MAQLKSVDLKVSVNCCEGCKRKVLKALSIKGVMRAEIHPTLPKVTVIGDVDVGILIKKLSKVGKSAEILAEEKEDKSWIDNESKSNRSKDEIGKDDKEGEKTIPMVVETTKEGVYPTIVTAIPQMSSYQTISPQANKVYYPAEPIAYYIQEYYRYYEPLSYHPSPPPQSQAMAAFGDYFNEDNTWQRVEELIEDHKELS